MAGHNKNFEWRYVGYIFSGLVFLFIVVFLINLLIVTEAPFKVAQGNDWIGFWGSVLGSILSGITTFIVLKITINNENKKREYDKNMAELQRLEDKRMSVLPYLNYSVIDDEYIQENKIDKELKAPLFLTPKSFEEGTFKIDCSFNLLIENLGLGVGIEPRIEKIYYDGKTYKQKTKNITMISVGYKAVIKFNLKFPDEGPCPITIKIGYFNIMRDYYEQEVVVKIDELVTLTIDKHGKPQKVKGKSIYTPVVSSIDKPKIIEDYKSVNINAKVNMG